MHPGGAEETPSPNAPPENRAEQNGAGPVDPRYDVAFEYAVDAQATTDIHGIILNVNHAASRLFGVEKRFLIGKPLGFYFSNSARHVYYGHLARFTHGFPSCSFESGLLVRKEARDVLVLGITDTPKTIRWILRDTTSWKQAEVARVDLLRKLLTAQADERGRLARDLHDNVGQLLTGLTLALGSIAPGSTLSPNGKRALTLAEKILAELRQAVHDIAHGFRAGLLDQVGLSAALEHLVSEWHDRNASVQIKLDQDAMADTQAPPEIEAVVFALIQEGLTNVHRHAHARHVHVRVERGTELLTVTMHDDGKGFDAQLASHQSNLGRLGLIGMQERVALVGGTLQIDTAPGKGTKLTAQIPIPT